MQEWMIAMLVISVLLVLRDMAKTFFRGRSFRKAEQPEQEKNPQKEKVERYAASFRKLADSFYGLPYRKDYLSSGQVDSIIREACENVQSLLSAGNLLGQPVTGNVPGDGTDAPLHGSGRSPGHTGEKERLDERMQPLCTVL